MTPTRKHLLEGILCAQIFFIVLDTDSAILSLVTCYPFDARDAGGPLRYVVTARMLY